MEFLKEFLIKKSLSEEIFRIDKFERIINYLVRESGQENYIESVIVTDFERLNISRNTCAFYCNKKLYFSYLRTVHSNDIVNYIIADKRSKSYFINLNIASVILHELEHVMQEKRSLEDPSNIESQVLTKAYQRRKELYKIGIYDYFYPIDPIERQANIKSLRKIIEIERKNQAGLDFFDIKLKKTITSGYSLDNPSLINPFYTFFDKDLGITGIESLDYDKRIELGLPVKKFIK